MINLLRTLTLAVGITIVHSFPVSAAQDRVRFKEECTRDRCVYYDRSGNRVGSVTRDDTGRLEIRDKRNNLKAKIRENDDGSKEITSYDSWR